MPITHLRRAILETLAYADLFDQPLTIVELHRYLHGVHTSADQLERQIADGILNGLPALKLGKYLVLEGREEIIRIRKERVARSQHLWPAARQFGRIISGMPFVRMVAVTGALSVSNVRGQPDIDYLVVTFPERVWLSRLFVVLIVRLAALRKVNLCPNYFLTTRRLALEDRSIFTAHELMQMVPLSGPKVYGAMRAQNSWADQLLPNAQGSPLPSACKAVRPWTRRAAEKLFLGKLGARLDAWEMSRKIIKFENQHALNDETLFDPDTIQGHFNRYRAETLARFNHRMETFSHFT